MIEQAYLCGEALGLAVWCEDEAGPFQTVPYPGHSWQPQGQPHRQPHEYQRNGTAKLLTLFHPASGQVRVQGITHCPNTVLHPWLLQELTDILANLPAPAALTPDTNRALWQRWIEGLAHPFTLLSDPPPLRLLLVLDNLKGHRSHELVLWFFYHGIMPLYTPVGGSWLNMAESIQRILQRRALDGQHPQTPEAIIAWLEAAARGWNQQPTPFIWGGQRAARRMRSRQRRQRLGGSGAYAIRPIQLKQKAKQKKRQYA